MISYAADEFDSHLILAAEECPPDRFEALHVFAHSDDAVLRKLMSHGPVLIRGGRGSGKSALLIEAHRRSQCVDNIFSVYMSLRYLPLLQSDGQEYIVIFCRLLMQEIASELLRRHIDVELRANDITSMQLALSKLSILLGKRIVILFDDAAHIGREKPLEVFFDLFRTLSSSTVSCKASIYPGVTRFGVRFDVYNDSTVIDISRSDISSNTSYFYDVLALRYPELTSRTLFSDRLSSERFANLLGRSVVGNMRAFILACNRFEGLKRIGIPEVNQCLLDLATEYYWPLMEEVAPKLGVYEPLVEPAIALFEASVEHVCKPLRGTGRNTAQDRIIVHRQLVSRFSKIFEILEYLGFISKREASRSMKSGGRGPVYALNLCSLIDQIPTKRLTMEMADEWLEAKLDLAEIHLLGITFANVVLPELHEEHGLGILSKDISVLAKSRAYPYGLTVDKVTRFKAAGLHRVRDLAEASDTDLDRLEGVGRATIQRVKDVLHQAIWM